MDKHMVDDMWQDMMRDSMRISVDGTRDEAEADPNELVEDMLLVGSATSRESMLYRAAYIIV